MDMSSTRVDWPEQVDQTGVKKNILSQRGATATSHGKAGVLIL